jgi:hypothetical protein
LCSHNEDALKTLTLIPDDPDDPTLAIERDHTAATAKMFSDPSSALPGLKEAAEKWRAVGNTTKEAWARGNAGVAYFNVSLMEEAAAELEQALKIFENLGDKAGCIATSSFLCLVTLPVTDPGRSTCSPRWHGITSSAPSAEGRRTWRRRRSSGSAWRNWPRKSEPATSPSMVGAFWPSWPA